jgi:hypothetical protein
MLAMVEGHPDGSRGAAGVITSAGGSFLLGGACLDVAPTPLPRFRPFEWMRDFDGGRLARRNPPLPLPGPSVRFGSRAAVVESVPLAAEEGAGPSTGLASALVQKASEAAIIGKMSTY